MPRSFGGQKHSPEILSTTRRGLLVSINEFNWSDDMIYLAGG
jgi:hypothetical protein